MKLQSVGYQVLQELAHLRAVGLYVGSSPTFTRPSTRSICASMSETTSPATSFRSTGSKLSLGASLGEDEQAVYEVLHALGGTIHALTVVALPLAQGVSLRFQPFGEGVYLAKRLLQVVRDHPDKVLQLAASLPQPDGTLPRAACS